MGIEAEGRKANSTMSACRRDGPGPPQAAHHGRIPLRRCRIAKHDRPSRRRLAGNVEQILDRNDHAIERTERKSRPTPRIGGIGGRAGDS